MREPIDKMFREHRKLNFTCSACSKTAKATEIAMHLTVHTPRCPAGHGPMKLAVNRAKKPRRGKPHWRWMNGERIG